MARMGLPAVVTPTYTVMKNDPKKLTPAFKEGFLHAMEKGLSLNKASLLCGLGKDTIHDWLANYRHNPNCPQGIKDLFDEVEYRKAKFEETMLARIDEASQDPRHWTAAAWMLERKMPAEYGRNRDPEATPDEGTSKGPNIQINQVILGDSTAREQARDLLRGLIGNRPSEPIGIGMGGESENGSGPAGSIPGESVEVDPC